MTPVKQKFFRGQRVRLAKKFPKEMSHFGGKGKEAIVIGSYRDQNDGGDVDSFSLLLLIKGDKNLNKAYECSWYDSNMMSLISDNRKKGEQIIQNYLDLMEQLTFEEIGDASE